MRNNVTLMIFKQLLIYSNYKTKTKTKWNSLLPYFHLDFLPHKLSVLHLRAQPWLMLRYNRFILPFLNLVTIVLIEDNIWRHKLEKLMAYNFSLIFSNKKTVSSKWLHSSVDCQKINFTICIFARITPAI